MRQRPATVCDFLAAAGLFGFAVYVTFPMTLAFLGQVRQSAELSLRWILWALFVSVWNGWFLGVPVIRTGWAWLLAMHRGDEERTFLYREYWVVQLAVLLPVVVLVTPYWLYQLISVLISRHA